ncbi:hypothetical protein Pst134EA_013467 [Puccinia striiformis f. sp. tritici]|uniref:hypothetical protein n=1 Tax=Puccinia striiformis f. sp. tritici TaxID=168172 RepID=UPI002007620D|nr:hypothetical protein Pst134EA_013467 [Puccinia striiformis f. sp. tritici]KAH9465585.1 hypothetical protein Pst134EA_013467 [Puccinia striiformis f. sp. tritici]
METESNKCNKILEEGMDKLSFVVFGQERRRRKRWIKDDSQVDLSFPLQLDWSLFLTSDNSSLLSYPTTCLFSPLFLSHFPHYLFAYIFISILSSFSFVQVPHPSPLLPRK